MRHPRWYLPTRMHMHGLWGESYVYIIHEFQTSNFSGYRSVKCPNVASINEFNSKLIDKFDLLNLHFYIIKQNQDGRDRFINIIWKYHFFAQKCTMHVPVHYFELILHISRAGLELPMAISNEFSIWLSTALPVFRTSGPVQSVAGNTYDKTRLLTRIC